MLSSSSSSTTWRQQLACCLVIVVVIVNIGLIQCEHDIDLGHFSADEVLIPTNNKLYPSYFVPFRAMDTARYLSALKRVGPKENDTCLSYNTNEHDLLVPLHKNYLFSSIKS